MSEEKTEIGNASDFNKLKVVDLKRMLKSKGLSVTGNKQDLIDRLQQSDAAIEDLLDATTPGEEGFDEELEELDENALMEEKVLENENKPGTEDQMEKTEQNIGEPPAKRKKVMSEEELTEADRELEKGAQEVNKQEESGGGGGEGGGGGGDEGEEARPPGSAAAVVVVVGGGEVGDQSASTDPNKVVKLKDFSRIENMLVSKDGGGEKTEEQPGETSKKDLRATRFGLPVKVSMQETLQKRAQRFGISPSATPSSNIKVMVTHVVDAEVLKKRAERFGITSSPALSKAETQKKLELRKQRFLKPVSSLTAEEIKEKKALRAQRFKLAT